MKIKFLSSFIMIIFSSNLMATELEPFRYLAHPLDASFNIANLLSADSPRPMDDAVKDKYKLSIAPTYFEVDQAFQTSEGEGGGALVRGDNLKGWGLSSAMGYGLSDKWQVYSMLSYITMDGKMFGRIPGNATADQYVVEGKNSVFVISSGLGYDSMPEDSLWKIPLYFGIFARYYKTDLVNSPLPIDGNPFTTIKGDGVLFGLSLGAQASKVYFEKLKVSPYVFVGYTVKGPDVTVTVTDTNGNGGFTLGQTIKGDLDSYPYTVAGLSIGWVPWGVEFSVSGPLISLYSEEIYEGLKLTKYSVTFEIL